MANGGEVTDLSVVVTTLDRDEHYDEDPFGDPPIMIGRYRQGCRVPLALEESTLTAPEDWPPEDRSAFNSGVSGTIEAMIMALAVVLTGPSQDRRVRLKTADPASRAAADRNRIGMAIERDEDYDRERIGDPPISVPRYRRAWRVLITTDYAEYLSKSRPSGDERAAFDAGIAAVVYTTVARLASILQGGRHFPTVVEPGV
jgi:hypothetical protein